MKIESSSVTMASQSTYKKFTETQESLKVWGPLDDLKNSNPSAKDAIVLSAAAKNLSTPIANVHAPDYNIPSKDEQELTLLQQMLEVLTGKKIKFRTPTKIDLENPQMKTSIQSAFANRASSSGFEYKQSSTHYESESTAFSAQASVTTADGRAINIDLQLSLSREFLSHSELNIKVGQEPSQMIDPLVINFNTDTAALSEGKYQFDIDHNGSLDQISFLGSGSGFLALDLNKDGIINDGSELFGPQSGNGFADLANYDLDGNQWIDENDAIYDKLQIWSKDEAGKDILMALGQRGIGAIYLGNVSTRFSLNGSDNQTHGQLQRTGFFLNEDGRAGTVQHLDLTI